MEPTLAADAENRVLESAGGVAVQVWTDNGSAKRCRSPSLLTAVGDVRGTIPDAADCVSRVDPGSDPTHGRYTGGPSSRVLDSEFRIGPLDPIEQVWA
ncbi:uncharacterized protein A4U43_C02F10170 [Asparagus officinalis]|uniref:Uncharacterized protein n=1 Tax=Asparagus officinalis TaxID=4686 RepID=A0A5P1FI30_ASPOF|nr:uncharacterized protein A4U43_C02F10170 [Asparagus officinalis]